MKYTKIPLSFRWTDSLRIKVDKSPIISCFSVDFMDAKVEVSQSKELSNFCIKLSYFHYLGSETIAKCITLKG